jgi:hypothetical protein
VPKAPKEARAKVLAEGTIAEVFLILLILEDCAQISLINTS